MKPIAIMLIFACACWCMLGCEEESGGGGESGSSGTTAQQGTPPAGQTPGGGGTGGADASTGATPHAAQFAITGVAPDDIAPDADTQAGSAEGRPVVRYHVTPGQPGERDITFLGKFPSADTAEYKVSVKVDDPQQTQMNQDLRVVSVAGDRIVVHFPSGSDLFGLMTITVEWSGHKTSIDIYIP